VASIEGVFRRDFVAELGINCPVRWLGLAALLLWVTPVEGAPFSSPNNLVVLRLGTGSDYVPGATQSLHLDEYNLSGSSPMRVQTLDLASTGASAVTLPEGGSHDGIMNRSADGHYLVFAGYGVEFGADDPTSDSSDPSISRVIVRADGGGTVDTSTVLTDGSFFQNTVRAVATDNGSRFWVAGDNANNPQCIPELPCASTKGGLRYVASLGASTSVNLSQIQDSGGFSTPDNVRDVGIFDGMLFASSGSNASVGKSVLQVERQDHNPGLPTATMDQPQILNRLTTDESSTAAFYFADLDPGIAGIDTMYASGTASGAGIGIHKYSKVPCSSGPTCYEQPAGDHAQWVSNGYLGLNFDTVQFEAIAGTANGSTVTLYATNHHTIYRLTDSTGYNHTIAGPITGILTADANESFRGLAFAPTAAVTPGDYNGDHIVDAADYTVWRDTLGSTSDLRANGDDTNGSMGKIDQADYVVWKANFGMGGGAGAAATLSDLSMAIPEPSTRFVGWELGMALAVTYRFRRAAI
jgi:hypothetical protein